MKALSKMTIAELAAYVQSHLHNRGIEVVLLGGACVSIYSNNKYISRDLDLINIRLTKRRLLRESMKDIGFTGEGRYSSHPNTEYFVEFPEGPLAVGEEPLKSVNELKLITGVLRLISPTDCVKDRLASY